MKINCNMNSSFGIISKEVMQNKKLSIEAKCLYAYFSSFLGSGSILVDSKNTIMENLSMSENVYDKALNDLKDMKIIE